MAIYLRNESWYYDFVHKGQRYSGCIGKVSKTIAKEELTRKKAQVVEGRLNPAKAQKSPRFDAFAEEYLDWVKLNNKPLTHRNVGSRLKPLLAKLGTKKLNEITAWHMEQYKKTRKEAGLAPSTINNEITLLKSMFNKAVRWKKLVDHPGKDVQLLQVVSERPRFLSDEEETKILEVCSRYLLPIVETGLLTGFRPRELTSLRPEDVDLKRNLITVAACYSKNGESRTLPMGPKLRAILLDALAARGDAATVFVTRTGKPWGSVAYGVRFLDACDRAQIPPCGPHVLRHTFASRLVMAGVDLRTVQELMGHKTITMTLRYTHLSPDHKRKAMEVLESRSPEKSPANFHNTRLSAPLTSDTKVA